MGEVRLIEEKCEKINGKVYNMSPAGSFFHSTVNENIKYLLSKELSRNLCRVYSENVNYKFDANSSDFVIPDVMIICDRNRSGRLYYTGIPKFIAETISKSTERRDKGIKKSIYEKAGVREYWIVNPYSLSITVYWLKDGKYVENGFYALPEYEEEKKDLKDSDVKCEIFLRDFPGVTLRMEDIFEGWEDFR